MDFALIGQAAALFAVSNIDDIVVLAVFFGQAIGHRGANRRVVIGQYLGFVAILALAVIGSLGAGLLPEEVIPYLGLIPLLLGLWALWKVWRNRGQEAADETDAEAQKPARAGGPTIMAVALVTFANGGDNIGLYIPVFTTTGIAGTLIYCAVFLLFVAVWCLLGKFVATRPPIAKALEKWGHIILPFVLIAIGAFILIEGGAFGLPGLH